MPQSEERNDRINLPRFSPGGPSHKFQPNLYNVSDVLEILKEEEGWFDDPYRDPYGKWTVGYGTLIGDGSDKKFAASPYAGKSSLNDIRAFKSTSTPYKAGASISQINKVNTEAEAQKIALGMAKGEAKDKLKRVRGEGEYGRPPYSEMGADAFDALPRKLQNLVLSSAYRGGITGSPKTNKLIKDGDFIAASAEFLDSDEYRDALLPDAVAPGVAIRMETLSNALREHGQDMRRNWGDDTVRRILGKFPQGESPQ